VSPFRYESPKPAGQLTGNLKLNFGKIQFDIVPVLRRFGVAYNCTPLVISSSQVISMNCAISMSVYKMADASSGKNFGKVIQKTVFRTKEKVATFF